MKKLLILLTWALLTSCGNAQSTDTPQLTTGYLYKVEPDISGKITYICGQRPVSIHGDLVATGDLIGQTKQVFDNIKTSLATVNLALKDVVQVKYSVKSTAPHVSGDTVKILNDVGAMYLSGPPQIVDVKSIPKIVRDDILVEVEVIASK